ncbi:hypothetical protein QR680_010521 [Steinernema hermaphroditum]|uniref:Uncharacterized protein n=1 Tax=Steinernema hermaphroditum TaxID=289476 RepID=A0AA39IPB6_9BILA|nr:hypothetical protein QR680_010521 [Steinernema hermaphroditum]
MMDHLAKYMDEEGPEFLYGYKRNNDLRLYRISRFDDFEDILGHIRSHKKLYDNSRAVFNLSRDLLMEASHRGYAAENSYEYIHVVVIVSILLKKRVRRGHGANAAIKIEGQDIHAEFFHLMTLAGEAFKYNNVSGVPNFSTKTSAVSHYLRYGAQAIGLKNGCNKTTLTLKEYLCQIVQIMFFESILQEKDLQCENEPEKFVQFWSEDDPLIMENGDEREFVINGNEQPEYRMWVLVTKFANGRFEISSLKYQDFPY